MFLRTSYSPLLAESKQLYNFCAHELSMGNGIHLLLFECVHIAKSIKKFVAKLHRT